MVECNECGKRLGFVDSYRHPVKGKQYPVCNSCFDSVNESVNQWREFISPYQNYFNNNTPKNNVHFNFMDYLKQVGHRFHMSNRL
jgi:hypothetical protein